MVQVDDITLKELDWESFLAEWRARTNTVYGQTLLGTSLSLPDFKELRSLPELFIELNCVLDSPSFVFPFFPDIRFIETLPQGKAFTVQELWQIKEFWESVLSFKTRLSSVVSKLNLRSLIKVVNRLNVPKRVLSELNRCLDSPSDLKDDASPELKRIRQAITSVRKHLKDRMETLARELFSKGLLWEPIYTVRNDRFVLPVKVERSSEVRGIVQGLSSSERTAFIEPMELIHLNNELVRLSQEESEEVNRILQELSLQVLKYKFILIKTYKVVGELDISVALLNFLRSRGKLCFPEISDKLVVRGAVHPLLKSEAVPIDIIFGHDRILVLTGPNAGGKTVALKTLGLCVLLARLGLPVPAEEMELPEIDIIVSSIGDEQDISKNLSTFSAQALRWLDMCRLASKRALLLLDEPASGTSPREGTALALALLEYLKTYNAWICVTTHFDELKLWALTERGVRIASFGFNIQTLQPTFRLNYGAPGGSYAIELSERIGLYRRVVDRAKQLLTENTTESLKYLDELIRLRDRYNVQLENLNREREELMKLRREVEKLRDELKSKRRTAFMIAKQEARAQFKVILDRAQELLKELGKIREIKKLKSELDDLHAELERKSSSAPEDEYEPVKLEQLKVGDIVVIKSLRLKARILEVDQKHGRVKLEPLEGNLNVVETSLKDIGREKSETSAVAGESEPKGYHSRTVTEQKSVRFAQIMLRKMSVQDALIELDRYLNHCFKEGISKVKVIHGKGQGILRRAVHEYLQDLKTKGELVKDYQLASLDEGGEGVTWVHLICSDK